MDILSLKEMVACEEAAFRSGVSAPALMESAGEAMAHRVVEIYPHAQKFVVLVGKGNNGGDGLVVARTLSERGRLVQIVLIAPEEQLGKLPREQLDILRGPFPNLEIVSWRDDFKFPGSDSVIIDALLGVQARGVLRGTVATVVAEVNAARARNFFRTVALDLPTGLAAYEESDAPLERDAAITADVTIAVGFAKEVLCREALSAWVGRLEVVPWSREESASAPCQLLLGHELAGLLPRRSAFSNKSDYGRLAIIAGSLGFSGAPVLCAQAAQAMGAGLISVVTRSDISAVVAAQSPHEAMVSDWPKGKIPDVVRKASAIVIGPGLGIDRKAMDILRGVLELACPILIDADGLNLINILNDLGKNLNLLRRVKGPLILTPHPGEMARLIGRKFGPEERETVAREFVDRHEVTLVLKGTRTLIAAPGQPLYINSTGNPGLSTGGSGDTLSGILGALLAQGLAPLDAARLGVWLHGHAADLVLAGRGCEEGMTPTMLSAHLGTALVSLRDQGIASDGLLEHAKHLEPPVQVCPYSGQPLGVRPEAGCPETSAAVPRPALRADGDNRRCPV